MMAGLRFWTLVSPSCSRDGSAIYMSSNSQIWKLPAAGGEGSQVTRTGGMLMLESADGKDLYYVKNLEWPVSLWRMSSTAGASQAGEPVKLLNHLAWAQFFVLDKGIYYLTNIAGENRLEFFSFASGKSTTVARHMGNIRGGLTASR